MRKTKKPAIASEWRENKEAQQRADQKAAREQARAARAEAFARFSGAAGYLMIAGGWVVCIALAVLFGLSLATYSPADPGFSVTGTQKAANLCGIVGAWAADFSYWLVGRSAWWVVAVLAFSGVQMVRALWARANTVQYSLRPWSASVGFVILMSASVGLETLQFGYAGVTLPLGAGGLYGQFVASQVTPFFGIWGSTFLFMLLTAVGLSFVFDFSWFDLAEKLGLIFETIVKFITTPRRKEKPQTVSEQDEATEETTEEKVEADLSAPAEVKDVVKRPSAATTRSKRAKAAAATSSEGVKGPDLEILIDPPSDQRGISEETVEKISRLIETKLKTYRIDATVVGAQAGPVITQYWLELAPGVKGSRVDDIRRDLTRSLSVDSVRVVPVIPGKPYMGLEIPNGSKQRLAVYLKEIIGSPDFTESKSALSLALGKDIAGKPVVVDLAKMPHLLVGGTTGSGKSVCINTMILSLLYKSSPDRLRLVLIDPKTVEFSLYQDIPHLLCPVVTDMNKASNALNWLVNEMDRRYNLMSKLGVRSFDSFNDKVSAAIAAGNPIMDPFDVSPEAPEPHTPLKPFAYIVCFIDELADLILINRKQVETQIMRLAQKARAAGIHLVLATQRPSVDIVTPLIKANIVARVCFQVASRFDSQVVLDDTGAQDLLGKGDMLFKRPGQGIPQIPERFHRIMKNDDRPPTHMAGHVMQALTRRHPLTVIPAQHIPHDQIITFTQTPCLSGRNPRVRRAEQIGMEYIVRKVHIFNVVFETHAPPLLMAVRMIPDGMPSLHNHAEKMRILFGILPETKKGGFGIVLGQLIENPLRNAGSRTVIEGQIDLIRFGHRPDHRREKATYEFRRLYAHAFRCPAGTRPYRTNIDFEFATKVYVFTPIIKSITAKCLQSTAIV